MSRVQPDARPDPEGAPGEPATSGPAVPPWSFWCFAAAYALLALAGRATAVVDQGPSLVWPAAGVGLLWVLARPGRRWALASSAAIAVIACAMHAVTGAAAPLVVAGTAAAVSQAGLGAVVLRRWRPDLLGARGTGTISDPRTLTAVVGSAVLGTGVGTALAATSFAASGETVTLTFLALWWGRNLAGMLLVGTSGHLLVHALATRTRILESRRLPELGLVVLAGLVTFVLVDLDRGGSLTFLLIVVSVWCAMRFSTTVAALQVVGTGAAAFGVVLATDGLAASAPDDLDALAVQAFVITLLVITLAIGSTRDQRDASTAQLRVAQQEARARAEFLETVTEVMAEGLVVLDADANLVRMNPAARAMLSRTSAGGEDGVASEEFVVTTPGGTVLRASEHPSYRAITEGRVGPEDIVLHLGDGTRRTLSVVADRLVHEDGSGGSVVVYRDVTGERRHADQLAEFAATAAHDLRNPLTALRGWLEMAADTDDPVVLASLDRARGAAIRMQELISDLLEQASAEGGLLSAAELEAVPLDLAVDDVLEYLDAEAVVHRAEDLVVVSAQPDMLRQLLTNLLGNAVKYVEPGVRPEITVSARRVGDRVEVEVADNGIGIPEDQRARVFERLHRAHAEDDRFAGTGLGLAICKTIVVRHGGLIECRPAPGGGTVFAFDLPAAVPDVPPVTAPVADGVVPDEA
ncbi:ATP-binding protein [Nocardioides sp. CFH 31398]|uniref:ATP-binding protein n=1 Tax=Nocardioides sp. CFH 31398 TaxID=2919579 RepID=UPI001F05CF2D|nr:ATP-binding protein [Nocardioides sp. CFH 31398]MCH1865459.1 ATP-binding protein [Nocardioides sp. CFH 31398]